MLRRPSLTFGSVLSGIVLCALLGGRSARSEAQWTLEYTAPKGQSCPTREQLLADIEKHTHAAAPAGVRLGVTLERSAEGFRGALVVIDPKGHTGRRTLDGATCAEVGHALAFLGALALDLGGRLETEEPVPSVAPSTSAAPSVVVSAAPPPTPTPAPAIEPPRGRSTLEALAGVRTDLPGLAKSGALAFERRRSGVGLVPSIRIGALFARGTSTVDAGAARLDLFALDLGSCPLQLGERIVLRACVGVELGVVRGVGDTAVDPRSGLRPHGGLFLGGELEVRIVAGLSVFLGADALAPFFRTRFYFRPDETAHVVPAIALRTSLGMRFWWGE